MLHLTRCRLDISVPALIYVGWLNTSSNTGLAVSIPSAHMELKPRPCEAHILEKYVQPLAIYNLNFRQAMTPHHSSFKKKNAALLLAVYYAPQSKAACVLTSCKCLSACTEIHLRGSLYTVTWGTLPLPCALSMYLAAHPLTPLTFQSQTHICTNTQTHIVAIWYFWFLSHPPTGFQTVWVKPAWCFQWDEAVNARVDAWWKTAV